MFNLNKLISIVKKGVFSRNAFNINKKAVEKTVEELTFEEMDPEVVGDKASQWLAQQGVAPIPSDIKVQQPPQISENVMERMQLWLKDNAQEIAAESVNNISELIKKKNESPEDSYLNPDVILYREIMSNPSYKNILSDQINTSYPLVDKNKSDLFVDTMMAKTQGLMGLIEEREREISEKGIEDIKPDVPERGNIDIMRTQMAVQSIFDPNNLSDKEKLSIMNTLNLNTMYDERQLSNAVVSSFNDKSNIDPRFNFFLKNPEFLSPVFSQYGSLEKSLLEKLGIQSKNINKTLQNAYDGGASTQKPIIDILNESPHGQAIIDELNKLINSKDLSVVDWFSSDLKSREKEYGARLYDSSGKEQGRSSGYEDKRPVYQRERSPLDIMKQKTMTDISKRMASVILYYLDDNLNNMKNFNNNSTIQAMEEYSTNIQKIKEEMRLNPNDASLKTAFRRANSDFAFADEMNAFVVSAQGQIKDVFNELGSSKKLLANPNIMKYQNSLGEVVVPTSVLRDIFGTQALSRGTDPKKIIENFKKPVDIYKEQIKSGKIKNPYKPNWKYMINNRLAYNSLAELGELKSFIREGFKSNKSVDSLLNKINSNPNYRKKIESFTGITEDDINTHEAERKKLRYIISTIEQDNANVKYPIEVFKMKQKYDEQRAKYPSKRYDPTQKNFESLIAKGVMRSQEQDNKVKEINKKEDRNPKKGEMSSLMHSVKTRIGDNMQYILPQLANFAEDKKTESSETKEAAKAFVSMFDHNPTKLRNFTGLGRNRNRRDKLNRYNTELYYTATQTPIPDHIQKLMHIKNQDIGWKDDLFQLYDNYEQIYREGNNQEQLAQVKQDNIKQVQQESVIPKLTKILESVYADKSGKKLNKILRDIPKNKKQKFIEFMSYWDKELLDEKPFVPTDYLLWAGLKQQYKTLTRLTNEKIKYKEIAQKRLTTSNTIKKKIENILINNGYDFKLPALKIAYIEYKKTMYKIAQLLKIRKSSYKFAFINTASIDDTVEKIRKDFNNFFDNLLK